MSESTIAAWPPAVRWDDIPGEAARGGVYRRGFGTDRVLLVMHDLYPSKEARDAALQTGMMEGMSSGFNRLDEHLRTMA